MSLVKASCLSDVVSQVARCRADWGLKGDQELWFRGESRDYKTRLRPELYRPAVLPNGLDRPLKAIDELLSIERRLYDEFQRNAVEYYNESQEDWEWDSYFLMQHHDGPTRLLDWSDGALIALHFAIRNLSDDTHDACVYVLENYRLMQRVHSLPDHKILAEQWRIARNSSADDDDWDSVYLPNADEKFSLPAAPLVLEFPHFTRRIAAQRSRFIAFGVDAQWMADEADRSDSTIKKITIECGARLKIRQELRDCGITESVIYPDLDGLGREMRQLWKQRREQD